MPFFAGQPVQKMSFNIPHGIKSGLVVDPLFRICCRTIFSRILSKFCATAAPAFNATRIITIRVFMVKGFNYFETPRY
jgi:hypothetical protein